MTQLSASPWKRPLTPGPGDPARPAEADRKRDVLWMQVVRLDDAGECFIASPVGVLSAAPSLLHFDLSAESAAPAVCGAEAPPPAAAGR